MAALTVVLLVSACGKSGPPAVASSPSLPPYTLKAIEAVTEGECVAGNTLEDGMVRVAQCGLPRTGQVIAVTTMGANAPDDPPSDAALQGLASQACDPVTEEFKKLHPDVPFVGIPIYPEAWSGSETRVLCAVQDFI
jgi:hypothetical protein